MAKALAEPDTVVIAAGTRRLVTRVSLSRR
jgi:hypothetical protein